jgi:hypothetical protein
MGRTHTPAWLFWSALLGVWLFGTAAPARACISASEPPFVIDLALRDRDSTPPSPFTGLHADAWREAGTHCNGASCSASSCGDRAAIDISFERPVDDQADVIGYRLVWLRGDMPGGLTQVIQQPQTLPNGTSLTLFIDFASAPRMNGDFALIAIDPAGNESAPSAPVHVEFSGCTRYFDDHSSCTESTCSVVPGPGSASNHAQFALWLLGAAALARGLRSRWRQRRHYPH